MMWLAMGLVLVVGFQDGHAAFVRFALAQIFSWVLWVPQAAATGAVMHDKHFKKFRVLYPGLDQIAEA